MMSQDFLNFIFFWTVFNNKLKDLKCFVEQRFIIVLDVAKFELI